MSPPRLYDVWGCSGSVCERPPGLPSPKPLLNTPDNGAPNGAATTHRGQVAPPASHTTQVAGGEFIAAGADSLQTNIIGKRRIFL